MLRRRIRSVRHGGVARRYVGKGALFWNFASLFAVLLGFTIRV